MFVINCGGSIYLLRPNSAAGHKWIREHTDDEPLMFGDSVVVEHRYIRDIVAGLQTDGLEVK
jgi:hypothetical protein